MNADNIHVEELDLTIPDMDAEAARMVVKASLKPLPGIIGVMFVGRGAFIRYNPNTINEDQICAAVLQAGYRASVLQDSKTGQTGQSSQ